MSLNMNKNSKNCGLLYWINTVTPEILTKEYKYTHYLHFNQWGLSFAVLTSFHC